MSGIRSTKKDRLKRMVALFSSAALLMSGLAFPPAAPANPGDPFPGGNSIIFVAQTGSATNNTGTQLYEAHQGKNSVVNISPSGAIDPISYNAMGFNINDMYLYAIEVGSDTKPIVPYNNLVRIGQDGVATVLGPITGLPNAAPGYNAGEMGGVGTPYANTLFVRAGDNSTPNSNYMWLVDVTTRVATRVTLSKPVPNTADLFWYQGYLWAFDGTATTGTATQTVDRISPTGTVDKFTIGNLIVKDSYGAQWVYGSGMVGILGNQTGKMYQIIINNPTSATPTFTVVNTLSGPTTNGNDGAAYPGEPINLGLTKSGPSTFNPGSILTYTIVIKNNDPEFTSTGYVVTDTLPAGLLNPTTTTDGATITNAGGVNTLRYVGGPLGPGETLTITVSGGTSASSMAPVVNTASVDGNENDNDPTNNTDTLTSTPQVTALQANPDTNRTPINTPVSGNALTNDTGDAITVTAHSNPLHGTVTIGTDGTYLYTPANNFTGTDTFNYTITDSHGATSQTTVTITVDPLPHAVDDTNRTPINTPVSGNALTNDTGAQITRTSNTNPLYGTVTMTSNGAYTYTPSTNFTGTDSFQYTITDVNGKTDVATVTITVDALPKANNDSAITSINTPATGNVLPNDTGVGIKVTSNTQPAHGTVTVSTEDGSYVYTPEAGYTGPDSFTYTITDVNGKTSTATVNITVNPLPRANPDTNHTNINIPVTGNVLPNDTGVGISVTSNTQPSHGTVTVAPDGTYTYTPYPGYTGPDSFVYTITDAAGKTSTTTVTLAVDPLPVANPDTYHTSVNSPISGNVLPNDTGVAINVTSNTQPSHGTVGTVNADGTFTYTPTTNYTGTDTFTYTIADENGKTSTTTVTIMIDDLPQANDDSNHTPINTPVSGNVLTNDSGHTIAVTTNTQPSHGTVTLAANGAYTYTPTTGYTGPDSFTYTIKDVNNNTTSAVVYLTVDPLPVANPDENHTGINAPVSGNVLTNDTGVAITVTHNTQPLHGTVGTVNPDGTYTYTPNTGFTGEDSFVYTITDENGKTSTTTVMIDVSGLPKANDDRAVTSVDTPVSGNVMTNDTGSQITVTDNTDPTHGTVVVHPDGTYTYTPDPGYTGPDSFVYTITDEVGQISSATVTIAVDPLPVAVNDTNHTSINTPVSGNVLTNDSGVAIKVTSNTIPTHGTVTVNPDGTYTYTPATDYTGPDSFTYTITDEAGKTSTATVTITTDPLPNAIDDTNHTPINTPVSDNVLTNDTGVGITVISNTQASNGTVTVAPNGTYTYTPNYNFTGTDTFLYTIKDENGKTDVAQVTIMVDALPKANNDSYLTSINIPVDGEVMLNDTGVGILVTSNTTPSNGTVDFDPDLDGTFTYTPNNNFTGVDTFNYTITDRNGKTSTATVTVTVIGLPKANPDSNHTSINTQVSGSVLPNDTGTGITVTDNSVPGHGSVTVHADGTYTYLPTTGYTGPDSFTYTITDANGKTSTTTVSLTVDPLPVAKPDTNHISVNTQANGDVLTNDTGTGITVTSNTQPLHGTATVAANGTYNYTPIAGYTGTDIFTYTITDENGKTSTATVTITVDPLPDAVNDHATTSVDDPVSGNVLTNDSGVAITVTEHSEPTHGSVTINPDGTYTYTPEPGYTGPDSFTYKITDENGATDTATVTIAVDPLPQAKPDFNQTSINTQVSGNALSNDSGVGITVTDHSVPSNGTVTIGAGGLYTYTPANNFTGTDTFTYTITDDHGKTSQTTVTITVDAAPLARDDTNHTSINTQVSGNALTNDEGVGITVNQNTQPAHGTVGTVAADGTYTYKPTTGFTGEDSFTYQIVDTHGKTALATVRITVDPLPLASDDTTITSINTPALGNVLTNDKGAGITVTGNTQPGNGDVTVDPDGNYTYTPHNGFTGTDTFSYTITDRNGKTSTATVTVKVDPLPEAVDDHATTSIDEPVSGNVLTNDTGEGITVTSNTPPNHGKVTVGSNGHYTYTPDPGYTGPDAFTYTITDEAGQKSTALVTIVVDPLPVANPDTNHISVNTQATGNVLVNDTGVDIMVTSNTQPAHGTVTVAADGTYVYTPTKDYTGPDTFTYTITDENGKKSMTTVTLTVDPLPKADPDSADTEPGKPVTGNVLTNDTGIKIKVTKHTDPKHGTVTINPDGSYTYTPDSGYAGPDTFTYTITDENGKTSTATVTINVKVPYTITYIFKKIDGTKTVETTITVVSGTTTGGTGKVGAVVTPPGTAITANQPAGATKGSALGAPFVLSADPTRNNFVVEYVDTAPEILVKRDTIYVQKGVVLTLDQILAIAGVSIRDAEESIPLSKLDATGYGAVKWSVVNYPGTGYVISLEVADTPGLEAPVKQIAVFVEPYETLIKHQNPDPDYPTDKIPDGTDVGTDPGGDPIIFVPVDEPSKPATPTPVTPKATVFGLPKTGDVFNLTFPMFTSLGAIALFLFACLRRKDEESEPV